MPDRVSELSFTSAWAENQTVRVTEPKAVANIVSSLSYTSPYSPNKESIRQPWHLVIIMRDGSTIGFSLGSGNREHPETTWIQFGVEVYQNAKLAEALREAGLPLL